jgi:hypothetical protein
MGADGIFNLIEGYRQDTGREPRLLTTGTLLPNPAELLGSERMQHLIKVLRHDADSSCSTVISIPSSLARRS